MEKKWSELRVLLYIKAAKTRKNKPTAIQEKASAEKVPAKGEEETDKHDTKQE